MKLPYQHGFHAGNPADCLKHSTLILLLGHMLKKSKPFVYAETHAGAGVYHLTKDQPRHEYEAGIGRLLDNFSSSSDDIDKHLLPAATTELLAIARSLGADAYPGSPHIAASLCRPGDSLVLCERAEDQHMLLCDSIGEDPRASVLRADGYAALRDRSVCDPGKRALVMMDPPYQLGSDTERVASLVGHMGRHWRAARIAIWYPVTRDADKVIRLHDAVADAVAADSEVLAAELSVPREDGRGMLGSGMLLVKPPFGIEDELRELTASLGAYLAAGQEIPAESRVLWVSRGESLK